MVLKAEMQSREAESSNFYSSPPIQAEKDKKVVNLRHSCPVTQAEGAKTFVTEVYCIAVRYPYSVPWIFLCYCPSNKLTAHQQSMQCNPPRHPAFSTPPREISSDQILISTMCPTMYLHFIIFFSFRDGEVGVGVPLS